MSEGRLASSPPEVGRWRPLGWGAPSWRGGSSPKEMTTMVATMTRRMRRREMVSHQWRWRGWLGAAATVLTYKG